MHFGSQWLKQKKWILKTSFPITVAQLKTNSQAQMSDFETICEKQIYNHEQNIWEKFYKLKETT